MGCVDSMKDRILHFEDLNIRFGNIRQVQGMREILTTLYPYFVLLYIIDCLIYVGKQQVYFVSLLGNGFRLVTQGIQVAGLFSFSQSMAAGNPDLYPSESGIYFRSNDNESRGLLNYPEEFRFIPYAYIDNPTPDENKVLLSKDVAVKTTSSLFAKRLADRLAGTARTEHAQRRELIRNFMKEDTDIERIAEIHHSCMRRFGYIKILCTLLFIEFFILLPIALYWLLPPKFILNTLLANIGILYVCTVSYTYYLLSKVYGKNSGLKTTVMLSITLSPVAAIHALGYLTKDLFTLFDPAALAAYLLPIEKFKDYMRREIYRIHRACGENDDFGWAEFWQIRLASMRGLLDRLGLKEEDLTAQPEKTEDSADSYCPVCRTEYRPGFSFCSDCRILLTAYAQ